MRITQVLTIDQARKFQFPVTLDEQRKAPDVMDRLSG